MRNAQPREIEIFHTQDGQEPFTEWLRSLRDQKTRGSYENDLNGLKVAILATAALLGTVSLNSVSTSEQAIVSTLVR